MLTHLMRHLTLRLWLTFLIGGLGSLAVVPLVQALMGLRWVVLPVILFLALIFVGLGWALNTWGKLMIERLQAEGAVWERAGMRREASQRYEAIMGLLDSYLLTPGRRRQIQSHLLPKITRFHLSLDKSGPELTGFLRAYLEAHPGDAEVAARWLRLEVDRETPPPWAHDLALRIGEAQTDSEEITALLARFYLNNGRCDHAAMNLYRRHWQASAAFRNAETVRLAQLLSTEAQHDRWALEVYLDAWSQGVPGDKLRPAVRRCLAGASPAEGDGLVARARELVGSAGPAEVITVSAGFGERLSTGSGEDASWEVASGEDASMEDTPSITASSQPASAASDTDLEEEAAFIYRRRRARPRLAASVWMAHLQQGVGRRLMAFGPFVGKLGQGLLAQIRRPWGKALGLGFLALALIFLISNTVAHLRPGASSPPAPVPVAAPVVTDPFTIQVAAYLKAEDAKAYAQQLKDAGLAAYWTEAVGANRKWFQVRIDHFATKAAARQFGEDLKVKGLINDFYVANYQPPQATEKQ